MSIQCGGIQEYVVEWQTTTFLFMSVRLIVLLQTHLQDCNSVFQDGDAVWW